MCHHHHISPVSMGALLNTLHIQGEAQVKIRVCTCIYLLHLTVKQWFGHSKR